MSPEVFAVFAELVAKRLQSPANGSALEIGAGAWTLLSIPTLRECRKVALNLRFDTVSELLMQTEMVVGNSNAMDFQDKTFDCVMSCSAIEHDRYFWRSLTEIRRVLKTGGLFVVGVPIYMTLPTDCLNTTLTYARHGVSYDADVYRLSQQAVREVFFEGFSAVLDEVIVRQYPNPYLVAAARK